LREYFWASECYVSAAGKDEEAVREDIRRQKEDKERLEQFSFIKKVSHRQVVHGNRFVLRGSQFRASRFAGECDLFQ
jgi:hypothetical protein